jgi:hypothetical protein
MRSVIKSLKNGPDSGHMEAKIEAFTTGLM